MKKNKWFGLALVATMFGASFSACINEAEEVLAQESEIKLTSEIVPSRVTSLDYQSTQIVAGQQVGVTITGAKSEHKNKAWTVETDGSLTNTDEAVYWGNTQATITAYHPYNSAWTGTSHTFSVSTDQSIEANYRNSDLLWATKTGTKSDETVALTFTHKLAKINVLLTSEDITDLNGATISICGTNIATNFNPSTGELSATTADVQEIKAGVTTDNAKTASAIIIPQTIVNGIRFIKVEHGDKIFYYTLTSGKTFEPGKSYNYNLKVKEKAVELALLSNNITDWSTGEVVEGDILETETIKISAPVIENITANSAQLSATATGVAQGIEISKENDFSNSISCDETIATVITAEFTSLEENTKYYARTYTIDSTNDKKYSETITFVPTSIYPKPYIIISDEGKTIEVIENGCPITSKGIIWISCCSHSCSHDSHSQEYLIANGEKELPSFVSPIEKVTNINDTPINDMIFVLHLGAIETRFIFCWYITNENGTTYSNVYSYGECDCPPEIENM